MARLVKENIKIALGSIKTQLLRTILTIVIIATLYGIAMEYVQGWVGRDFDVWDMVADAAGAVAAGSWLLIQKRRPW